MRRGSGRPVALDKWPVRHHLSGTRQQNNPSNLIRTTCWRRDRHPTRRVQGSRCLGRGSVVFVPACRQPSKLRGTHAAEVRGMPHGVHKALRCRVRKVRKCRSAIPVSTGPGEIRTLRTYCGLASFGNCHPSELAGEPAAPVPDSIWPTSSSRWLPTKY